MANLSDKLERIELAVDRIRTKVELPTQAIEEVATAVENMGSGAPVKSNVYRVGSLEERDAITDMVEGDMCVVYTIDEFNYDGSKITDTLVFPEIIKVNTAITGTAITSLITSSTASERLMFQLSATYYRVRDYKTMKNLAQYSSTDGKTYTRTSTNKEVVYPGLAPDTSFNSTFTPFIFMKTVTFDGMFTYKNADWVNSDIGISTPTSYVFPGKQVYTSDGVVEGNMFDAVDETINPQVYKYYNLLIEELNNKTDFNNYFKNTIDKTIPILDNINNTVVTTLNYCFDGNTNIEHVNLNGFKSPNLTYARYMFKNCINLKEVVLDEFNVSNCTDLAGMFEGCTSLETVDISSFDTSNLVVISSLFAGCKNLVSVNISGIDTSKARSFNFMFDGCEKMTSYDLSSFTTVGASGENPGLEGGIAYTFRNNKALTELDLSSLVGKSGFANMNGSFTGCTSLMKIDLRNMDFTYLTYYENTFGDDENGYVPANCLIIVKNTTQKNWLVSKFPRLTNVKTVAEYGA